MKITLLSYGTRGDVQPFVALASALQDQGVDVLLAAPDNHRDFVTRAGIPYAPLTGDIQAILESEQGRQWLSKGNVVAFVKAMTDMGHALRHGLMRDIHAACTGSDAIISQVVIQDLAMISAEKLQIPLMFVHLFPLCGTSAFPSPLVTIADLPLPLLNRWTHDLFNFVWWQASRRVINELRRNLGVRRISETANVRSRALKTPTLQVFSPYVLRRPRDWGAEHVVTGFWQLPDAVKARLGELEPPPALVAWLAAGPPPIYVGMGSMPVQDPAVMMQLVSDVATEQGVRAVIGAGWPVPDDLPQDLTSHVFVVNGVNHDWLFPKCTAIVHHGGAGTTAASLRAGAPTLICAVFADQPFWGKRLVSLGVGTWMPYAKLNHDTLLAGLRHLEDRNLKKRAAALGIAMRQEDGLANAVKAIAERLATAPIPR